MAEQSQGGGAAAASTTEEVSLLDDILSETQLRPSDEGYDVTKRGVQALITELLAPGRKEKVDRAFADALIAEIDSKISIQLDAILHDPSFQKMESAWR